MLVSGRGHLDSDGHQSRHLIFESTSMRFHCLGTTGYHPNDRRQTACYAVPEAGLVFDAGTGIYRLPAILETDHLDIFLSHAHLDHIVGLTFLLDILYQRPVANVRIWGSEEKLIAIQQHLFSEHIFPVKLEVTWCPLVAGQEIEVGLEGRLSAFPLSHPGGSLGYVVDWPGPHRLAYVTDTVGDPAAEYVGLIKESDLLVHECYFRDEAKDWAIKTGHTWTSRTAEVARAARAKQLLAVHINPLELGDDPIDIEIAKAIFPATTVAEDRMVIDF